MDRKNKSFMYEAYWSKEEECGQVLVEAWRGCSERGSNLDRLQVSFKQCSVELSN